MFDCAATFVIAKAWAAANASKLKYQIEIEGGGAMHILLAIGYIALGLFQVAAIMAGLQDWVGLHWLLAAPIALVIAYIPVAGTVVGMSGAIVAWHWSLLQAAVLFLGPLLFIAATKKLSDMVNSRRRFREPPPS